MPPMANLYAMTPIPCCRQPPKQALQRLSRPQGPHRSTLLARPKFLQAGLAVTLHRASRGLTLTGEVPQSLCTTWPNPFVHTRLPHLCYSLRRYRASRREAYRFPLVHPGSRGDCRFPHLCHRRLQGPCSLLPKQCSGSAQLKTSWQTPAQQGTNIRAFAQNCLASTKTTSLDERVHFFLLTTDQFA